MLFLLASKYILARMYWMNGLPMVKPRMRGRSSLTRFADDFVMVFEHYEDCYRVQQVLTKRFTRYGLTLHLTKLAA